MNQTIRNRVAKLREAMERAGVDYYMVPTADFHNSEYVDVYFKVREYLSGFTGSNGTLVVSRDEAGLWTDGRYFIQAENELEGTGITLFRMLDEGVPTIKEYLKEHMKEGQTLGFDGRVVDTAFGCSLEKSLRKRKLRLPMEKIWQMRCGRTDRRFPAIRSWCWMRRYAEKAPEKSWKMSGRPWRRKRQMLSSSASWMI